MNHLTKCRSTLLRASYQASVRATTRSIPFVVSLKSPGNKVSVSCQRLFASSSSTNDTNKPPVPRDDQSLFERTVYVHPLSQIILERFQDVHHDFVVSQGLDASLTVHRDGSFELKFPYQPEETTHRIWTSYDEVEKKHWLSVYRGPKLQDRFMLQDNLKSAWNNHRQSLPERIHASVDEMVRLVNTQVV